MDVRTDAEEFRELSEDDRRYNRMKHLRVDEVTFAEMVPKLIEEGLLSDHANHIGLPPMKQGRRTPTRNDEICARCEHLIFQQWKRNVAKLSADEAVLLDARFLWRKQAARQIVRYETLATAPVVTTTTVRKKIEGEEAEGYVLETTTREERRSNPAYFRMADELRANIARLAGVPVGEMSKVPSGSLTGKAQRSLVVRERKPDDQQSGELEN